MCSACRRLNDRAFVAALRQSRAQYRRIVDGMADRYCASPGGRFAYRMSGVDGLPKLAREGGRRPVP